MERSKVHIALIGIHNVASQAPPNRPTGCNPHPPLLPPIPTPSHLEPAGEAAHQTSVQAVSSGGFPELFRMGVYRPPFKGISCLRGRSCGLWLHVASTKGCRVDQRPHPTPLPLLSFCRGTNDTLSPTTRPFVVSQEMKGPFPGTGSGWVSSPVRVMSIGFQSLRLSGARGIEGRRPLLGKGLQDLTRLLHRGYSCRAAAA